MDSQLFYLLNFIFAGIFLLWFFKGRGGDGRRPTQLDLHAGADSNAILQKDISTSVRRDLHTDTAPTSSEKPKTAENSERQSEAKKDTTSFRDVTHTSARAEDVIKQKQKRTIFIYNGHDWDAYEVLGVGPSSTLPEITKKYQELIREGDQGQIEFLETAYKALLKNF